MSESNGQATQGQTLGTNNAGTPDGHEQNVQEAIREMAKVNFVVSTIVASVTYAAVVQVPGGYDNNGKANLSKNKDFIKFLFLNSFAFVLSLLSMFIHFCVGHGVGRTYYSLYAVICITTELSLVYLLCAFFSAVSAIWTEGLTVLLTWDNKTPTFSIIFTMLSLIIAMVFYAMNTTYLVPNRSP